MSSDKKDEKDLTTVDKFAIHEACREGKFVVVESFLNTNPKLANLPDLDERLPIHWAVSYGHKTIAELLMQQKDFHVDVQDGMGWTPLMIAASIKDGDELVEMLVKRGADVNMKNYNGQTALHFCASKGHISVARYLIERGANSRVKDKKMQQLPLHRAAAVGSVPLIKIFLENKSPVNATDKNGYTALHHAIAEGHGDAALELLKAGAETDKKDIDGFSPIQLAPDKKVVDWIKAHAANEGIEI